MEKKEPTIKQIVDALMCEENMLMCSDCFYYRDDSDCTRESQRDAAKALQKLIPQKPTVHVYDGRKYFLCPSCGEDDLKIYADDKFKFCPWCGQAIDDWSESDD